MTCGLRYLLKALALLGSLTCCAAERPHIILIMADDLGVEGIGAYGGESYRTPRVDDLAARGLRFTHAYAQPLCTPTRVQIMTGKYNHRNWLYFGCLDPREKTFGHYLKEAGYRTCLAGKWQLYSYDPLDYPGAEQRRGRGTHPDDSGFDEWLLFHAEHTEEKGSRYGAPTMLRNGTRVEGVDDRYGEDLSVEFLLEFLAENREHPCFLYYSMALPHWPMVSTPISQEWKDPENRLVEDVAYFPDMVEYMDILVGRIVDGVGDLGLGEDTLILFYSDNGTDQRIVSLQNGKKVPGGKGLTTQNGIHVPLIAFQPGSIAPGTCDDLVDASDFLPTLLEVAGVQPEDKMKLDGVSFLPQLQGRNHPNPREWAFFWYDPRPGWDKDEFTRSVFALDGNWKLYDDGRLYDIRADPLEQKSLNARDLGEEGLTAVHRLRHAIEATLLPH